VDWVGERAGMAACIAWWSICTMLTALSQGALSLGVVRFLLGLGEPGNYPAALRATTRWFPKAERGFPIACFSSGGAVGNILAPPLVAGIAVLFGWRAAFVVPGALGLLWLAGWLAIYRLPAQYPGISQHELAQLKESDTSPAPGIGGLLRDRSVLALILSRFVTDPVWTFYLFWIPEYLKRERGFSLTQIGLYAWIPFVAGALGGMTSGRVSDRLIAHGIPPVTARSRILYLAAAFAPLGILTTQARSAATAILLIAVMAFVTYSWFITTAAIIPDITSEKVVGSVLGFIGTAGAAAGALFSLLVGYLVTHYSYGVVFAIAGSLHVAGALIFWWVMPARQPVAEALHAA
jgi:ACS family hexuronate transporter-like MFS transporter